MKLLYSIFSKKSTPLVVLAIVSLAVHFAWFGHPNGAVFDEVHFGKFISAYFTGEYYFDIHPPLGKLIIAGWGALWGFEPGFSFGSIGDVYPDKMYMALRFLPSLAGALLPLVVYGIARRLRMGTLASFTAGILIALDNALLVQSRLILLDSFLLLFGFGAIYCWLCSRDAHRLRWLAVAGILGGMAMSIKWTGGAFLALIVVMEITRLWRTKALSAQRIAQSTASLIVLPIAIYMGVFAVHFALLPKTGPGAAFMTPAFQSGLTGNLNANNKELQAPLFLSQFVELNMRMYTANATLDAEHQYSSKWYTWPIMGRPIFYWIQGLQRIYFLGNPVVWWGSTAAMVILIGSIISNGIRTADRRAVFITGAWLLNLLPFAFIGRVMFMYHYLPALVWAVLGWALLIDRMPKPKRSVRALIALATIAFLFFAPLSYGLAMNTDAASWRVLFDSWR